MSNSNSFAAAWHSLSAETRISSAAFVYEALRSTSESPIDGAVFLSAARLNQNAMMIVYLEQYIETGGMRLPH
jgi:hypothetical protein